MKNTLVDLNNHLFAQIERLNDEELTNDELDMEIKRAKAMTDISTKIIDNADLVLQAENLRVEYGGRDVNLPAMLESKDAQVHR